MPSKKQTSRDWRTSPISIARYVAQAIEDGEFAPGSPLREQQLASTYQCSRSPVREALRILESQGLVIIEPMRGARVAKLHDTTFLESFFVRRALGGVIARLAAENGSAAQKSEFQRLADYLTELSENDAPAFNFHDAVRQLVRLMPEMSNASRTVQIVRALTFGREAFQAATFATKARRRQAAKLWSSIASAISSSDGASAARGMDLIFDQAYQFMASEWSPTVSE